MAFITPPTTTSETFAVNGTGIYPFTIEYTRQDEIQVWLLPNNSDVYVKTPQNDPTNPWGFNNPTTIEFTNGDPALTTEVKILRSTDVNDIIATFSLGSAIRAQDLNNNFEQLLFSIQEILDDNAAQDGQISDIIDDIAAIIIQINNSINYVQLADVTALDAAAATNPDNLKGYEVLDSTGITGASPQIINLPPQAGSGPGEDPVSGVYWNSGIVTRVVWDKPNQRWNFVLYYTADGDNRYQQLTLTNPITPDPADYKDGTLWFDSGDANLYCLYNDGNSRQWVITNPLSAYGQIVTSDDVYWNRNASNNVVYPKNATDNIGNNSSASNWVINNDGTANFNGDVTLGTDKITLDASDGYAYFGNDPTERVVIYGTDGQITIRNDSDGFGGTPAEAFGVFRGGTAASDQTVSIRSDGAIIITQPTGYGALFTSREGTTTSMLSSDGQLRLGGTDPTNSATSNIFLNGVDGAAYFASNVGIGTTTPGFGGFSKGLHVSDSAANAGVRVQTTAGIGGILEMYAEPGGATIDTRGSGFLRFNNASTELARFTSDGTFLINRSQRQGILPYAVELHSDAVNALDQPVFAGFSHSNTSPSYTAYLQLIRDRNGGRTLNTDVLGMVRFCGNDGVNGAVAGAEMFSKAVGDTAAGGCRASLALSTNDGSSLGASTKLEISPDGTIETYAKTNFPNLTIRNSTGASPSTVYIQGLYGASSLGSGGTASFYVFTNGDVKNATNSYTGISDITLKENIVPASEQWNNIKDIDIVNFNFKEETGYETHKQIGVIAQQVEEVSPGLVDTDEDGLKSVNYSVLNVKAIKALQEAMARIESLEARIAQRDEKLTELTKRIETLEGGNN